MRTLGNTTGADLGPVCTDSRQVRQGSVFVALKGERFDGHDYAAQAARDGASVVVVERDTVCRAGDLRCRQQRKNHHHADDRFDSAFFCR